MSISARRIDRSLLDHDPPRPLPPWLIADLIGDQLQERPLRAYFDPLLISGLMAALALVLLRTPLWISWLLALLMAVRFGVIIWSFLGQALVYVRLLRYGVVVRAHVLRVRASRSASGALYGAYLNCAMPVSQRRTSIGSVWLSDPHEATRLAEQGRVLVLCLPRAPGTWRLLEGNSADYEYEPLR